MITIVAMEEETEATVDDSSHLSLTSGTLLSGQPLTLLATHPVPPMLGSRLWRGSPMHDLAPYVEASVGEYGNRRGF